ncbi:MAG: type III-A CRISPR-associated RAMP protein Csm5 [Candidatus Parvarchaeota archaeon]|nr:type III-A CRISPR-associated RAMP protein Csm5 [Candidatus Jingweiarchaeum tengchongense]MCW1305501.1 type III-A CRISPR-associated RAMP protein Csm5 [Candidatus Jingweiarchaeum tengchongense]
MNKIGFKKYEFKVETLTPLHIGCGEKIVPMEYFIENGYLHVCNFEKFLDILFSREIATNEILNNITNLPKRSNFLDLLKRFDLENERYKFVLYKIPVEENFSVEFHPFIRHSNNQLFIPGSSIKGAIRTALISKDESKMDGVRRIIMGRNDGKKKKDKELSKTLEFEFKDPRNLMVRDIEIELKGGIMRIKRLGMGKNPRLTAHEFINISTRDNVKLEIFSREDICEFIPIINEFYLNSLNSILNMNVIRKNKEVQLNLERIRNEISNNKDNSNVVYLQVGFGGNYFTKSLGYQLIKWTNDKDLVEIRKKLKFGFKGFPRRPFPKTFTVVDKYDTQPGWIKLSR